MSAMLGGREHSARYDQALAQARMLDAHLRAYVLRNGHLPCPDITGDGIADNRCSSSPSVLGAAPVRTLKFEPASSTPPIHYVVLAELTAPPADEQDVVMVGNTVKRILGPFQTNQGLRVNTDVRADAPPDAAVCSGAASVRHVPYTIVIPLVNHDAAEPPEPGCLPEQNVTSTASAHRVVVHGSFTSLSGWIHEPY